MIQKKKFSDAIAANISVLEELLEFSNVFKYVTNNPSEPNLNNIKTNGIYFITNPEKNKRLKHNCSSRYINSFKVFSFS